MCLFGVFLGEVNSFHSKRDSNLGVVRDDFTPEK